MRLKSFLSVEQMANTRRNRNTRRANGVFGYAAGVFTPLVNTGSKSVGRIANTGKGLVNTTARGVIGVAGDVGKGLNDSVNRLFSPLMGNKSRKNRKNRKANRKNRRNTRRAYY